MKKNKGFRFTIGCPAIGLLLLLPSCSVRKQQEKSTWRQEESYCLHTDSLFSRGKRRMESESIRQWEMVRLSPPDSAGRQHVSAVVRSRDTRSSRSFSEESLRRNVTGTVRQKEDDRSRDKAEKQQTPTALWKWAAGVIAVIGGITGLRRIGRH